MSGTRGGRGTGEVSATPGKNERCTVIFRSTEAGVREKIARARTLFIEEPGDEAINLFLVHLVHPSRRSVVDDRARSVARAPLRALRPKPLRDTRRKTADQKKSSLAGSAPQARPYSLVPHPAPVASHPLALGGGVIVRDGRRDRCRRSSNSAPRWRCARFPSPPRPPRAPESPISSIPVVVSRPTRRPLTPSPSHPLPLPSARQECLETMVRGGDAIAPHALAALNEVVPDLDLDETGAPATPPSSDAKTLLEHALCRVLHRHVDAAGTARVPFMTWSGSGSALPDLPRLLDLALLVSERGACDHGAVFNVLEQLLEACTIADAEAVFTWVESARERLSEDTVWRRGRLVMLRACNDLQRRLSKTHDVVLRGRVSLLLSSLYSLSEKSALNLTGQYNRSNPTETEAQTAAETAASADPPPGSNPAGAGTTDATEEDGAVDVGFHKTFWSLQRFFREPPAALARPDGWSDFARALTAVLDTFETNALDSSAAATRRVRAQMAATPPSGAAFAAAVERTLRREDGWTRWKAEDGCADFERAAAPPPPPPPPPAAPRRRPRPGAAQPTVPLEKRVRLGNPELDRLWNLSETNAGALAGKRADANVALETYLQPVLDDMDPEAEIEEAYKSKNDKTYAWKAMRLVAKRDLAAFQRLGQEDLEAVAPGLLGVAPPGAAAGAGAGAEGGATANEDKSDKSDKSDVANTAAGEETGEETKKTATHTRFADVEGEAEADATGGEKRAGEGGGDDAATE